MNNKYLNSISLQQIRKYWRKCPRTLLPKSVRGHCVGLLGWCLDYNVALR